MQKLLYPLRLNVHHMGRIEEVWKKIKLRIKDTECMQMCIAYVILHGSLSDRFGGQEKGISRGLSNNKHIIQSLTVHDGETEVVNFSDIQKSQQSNFLRVSVFASFLAVAAP